MIQMEVASWSDFKTLVSAKALLPQYSETSQGYEVFATEHGEFAWHVGLLKGSSDSDDFEASYKTNYNKPLEIKAGVGRAERICVSPQPNNTNERWKGYEIDCAADDTSKAIDITFASKIYLRGGMIYSKDVVNGDKCKVEIQMQIGGAWTTIMTPMEDLFLVNGMRVEVLSPECMEFATTLRLKVTFTPVATGTAKKVYLLLDYYA